jgi:hypothetical protein
MSGCVSCGAPTQRRKCRECALSKRATERAEEPESLPDCPSCGGDTSGEGVTCYKCRGDRVETDAGRVRLEGPVFRVVCHGCEYEDVIDGDRVLAAVSERVHRKRTDHRVEYEEVSR